METSGTLGVDTYGPSLYGIRVRILLPVESEALEIPILESAFDAVGIRVEIDVDRRTYVSEKSIWLEVGGRPLPPK
jgi:hypothetical protein